MLTQEIHGTFLANGNELQDPSPCHWHCGFSAVSLDWKSITPPLLTIGRLTVLVLFISVEMSDRPFHASLLGIHTPTANSDIPIDQPVFLQKWPTSSTLSSSGERKRYEGHYQDPISSNTERVFWLQRQGSLSSQTAIYPPGLRSSNSLSRSTGGSVRSRTLTLPRHPQLAHSVSATFSMTPLPSVLEDGLTPTRTPSSVSSALSNSPRSPLSTMHRASQPDVPIVPDVFLGPTVCSRPKRRSVLPFAWLPSLHHAPLSADPAIRAFGIGIESDKVTADCTFSDDPFCDSENLFDLNFLETSLGTSLIRGSLDPPKVPPRAQGHTLRSTGKVN